MIDIASWTVKSTMPLDNAWLGLAWHPDGTRLYSAGAEQNNGAGIHVQRRAFTTARTFALAGRHRSSFAGGLAISPTASTLYATRVFAQRCRQIDIASGRVMKTVTLPAEPYTAIVVSADGRTAVCVALGRRGGRRCYDAGVDAH